MEGKRKKKIKPSLHTMNEKWGQEESPHARAFRGARKDAKRRKMEEELPKKTMKGVFKIPQTTSSCVRYSDGRHTATCRKIT
jgi:hypothetical protein